MSKGKKGGSSKVHCMLPEAEAVAEGKSVVEALQGGERQKHAGGRPPKFDTPELMQLAVDDYFDSCWEDKVTESTDENGKCTTSTVRYQNRPYTVMGLALHLDMTRETLCEYAKKGQFSDIVKKAKAKVEMFVEEQLLWSKSATGSIFWLKNHAGYKDVQQLEQSGPNGEPIQHAHKHELSDDMLAAIAAGNV